MQPIGNPNLYKSKGPHRNEILNIEALQSLPPVEFLWEGIIADGTLTAIVAKAGNRKTTFCHALASAVSRGESFLGRETKRRKVTIFDKENSYSFLSILSKANDLAQVEIDTGAPSLFARPNCFNNKRCGDEDCNYYKKIIEHAKINNEKPLLVFDSLSKFCGLSDGRIANEQSNTEMTAVMERLVALRNAGAAIILIHHSGKSEESASRGASAIIDNVDAAFQILPPNEAEGKSLYTFQTFEKNRFAAPVQLFLDITAEGLILDKTKIIRDFPSYSILAMIKAAQDSGETISKTSLTQDIQKKFKKNKKQIHSEIDEAIASGLLKYDRVEKGRYEYEVTEKGERFLNDLKTEGAEEMTEVRDEVEVLF